MAGKPKGFTSRPITRPAAGATGEIRVGVGGWTYEPWRGVFYPKGLPHKDELSFASRRLGAIEINGTFYRTQSPSTFARWRDETPDGFLFCVKAPRYIVQRRELASTGESMRRFIDSGLAELREKLGPILWQFAPTKKFDAGDLEAFLELLPRDIGGRPARHALEPRHRSFACASFIDLARKHGAAVVTACDSEYPEIADETADFVYFRIMGSSESRKTGYAPSALAKWAERAHRLAAGEPAAEFAHVASPQEAASRDVFLFFISGFKERNPLAAMELIRRLR